MGIKRIGSESEMQEVMKSAGKKLIVAYFFDTNGPDFREDLEEEAKNHDNFDLVEINMVEKSTEELKVKYLPGYTAGVGKVSPMLVFFHGDDIVRYNYDLIIIT